MTGPSTGTVYVAYTARRRGRLIAGAAKKAVLRHGRLRVTFKLSALAAAHAVISVSARIDHEAEVITTPRRLHDAQAGSARAPGPSR